APRARGGARGAARPRIERLRLIKAAAISPLHDAVSSMGRVNGGLYVAARALSRLTGDRARLLRYHFVAQPVPETAPANAVRASRMIVRCVAPPDRVIAQFPRADHVVADRFARGCICFVAER